MNNLDSMYYRNQAIIDSQTKCSHYKLMKTYSACSEEKIKATVVVDRGIDQKPAIPGKPVAAPAAPAAEPAPTPSS